MAEILSTTTDLGLYIRHFLLNDHHQDLYKKRGSLSTMEQRAVKMTERRTTTRHKQTFDNRNITPAKSTVATPKPQRPKQTQKQATDRGQEKQQQQLQNNRLDMLHKWKAQKEERKRLERLKAKPLFKVTKVMAPLGLPDLENVNREIKGKVIRGSFAPPNHKFKPPANVKAIDLQYDAVEQNDGAAVKAKPVTKKTAGNGAKTGQRDERVVTRSQSQLQTKPQVDTKNILKKKVPESAQVSTSTVPGTTKRIGEKKGAAITKTMSKTKDQKVIPKAVTKQKSDLKINSSKSSGSGQVIKPPETIDSETSQVNVKLRATPKKTQSKKKSPKVAQIVVQNVETSESIPTKAADHMETEETNGQVVEAPETIDSEVLTIATLEANLKSRTTPKKRQSKKKSPKVAQIIVQNVDSSESIPAKAPDHMDIDETKSAITPTKDDSNEQPPMYVSPFVTTSRGKNSARKAYQKRKSAIYVPENDHTNPKSGANFFAWQLEKEVERLQGMCQQWEEYKTRADVPEGAHDMIDVALGQTNLLITKKFNQFRGLIERCRDGSGDHQPVTCEDLHGFWDMIHIQVDNLDTRFANLARLRDNRWQEIQPESRKITKTEDNGKTKPKNKAVKASSVLRAAIQAARLKRNVQNDHQVAVNVVVKSKTPQSHKKSLQMEKLDRKRDSSPGLAMMRVSQIVKGIDTPGKSILKSVGKKSVQSTAKSVLFQDVFDQNDANEMNVPISSASKGEEQASSRRSRRLSKKLF